MATEIIFCPPFNSNDEFDTYLSSITPKRELICPITQEVFKDPVILPQDGHTYERTSLLTWFESSGSGTATLRSPVTNSLLENNTASLSDNLVSNLAVASMARSHREKLGKELIYICRGIRDRSSEIDDGKALMYSEEGAAVRIEALLDAGADPNGRHGEGANTPMHLVSTKKKTSLYDMYKNVDLLFQTHTSH